MLIRRERASDVEAVAAVHTAAFAQDGSVVPVEVRLVDALRGDAGWIPALSLVAEVDEQLVGHVVCTRGHVDEQPALGLGPLGVLPDRQRHGIGSALMHAVLGAADALDERIVLLLGHTEYYPRFGFRPAAEYGIKPPDDAWGEHFQARPLSAYDPWLHGAFSYAAPFQAL